MLSSGLNNDTYAEDDTPEDDRSFSSIFIRNQRGTEDSKKCSNGQLRITY